MAWTYLGIKSTNEAGIHTNGSFYVQGDDWKCYLIHYNEDVDFIEGVLVRSLLLVKGTNVVERAGNNLTHYMIMYGEYRSGTSYVNNFSYGYKARFVVYVWRGYPWPYTEYSNYVYS
ncbi:MAG: hypothetical protein KAQ75_17140 [Bacteroidales bacterium]|nr:hypothetical protein [Bacteroidales bacterium]